MFVCVCFLSLSVVLLDQDETQVSIAATHDHAGESEAKAFVKLLKRRGKTAEHKGSGLFHPRLAASG